jgi:DNA-binding transcriptional ArsR family regulator
MNTTEYLNSEITRLKKSTRSAVLVGIILTTIVVIYTVLGIWYVNVLTNPQDLSNFVLFRVKEQAPKSISAIEHSLIAAAPATAEKLSLALQDAIPQVRIRAQLTVNKFLTEDLEKAQKQAIAMVDAYFAKNKEKIPQRIEGESVADYGNRVAKALSDKLRLDINNALLSSSGHSIDDINAKSLYLLERFDHHIGRLEKTPYTELPRQDQLERLLIAYVINQYLADIPR